jgi:putative Mn2+ efflux pump MntP
MNNFEITILALALVFNSWNSYLNAGIIMKADQLARKINFTGIMFLVQFIMAGAGIWLGFKLGSFEMRTNILISLSILLVTGLKVLLSGIRSQTDELTKELADTKTMFFSALLEGIIPLFIGIAIGFLSKSPYLHWFLIGLILLSGILAALLVASRKGPGALKNTFESVGGFLLLSIAIKLALNIIRF